MKKLLFATTAFAGLATVATPALADSLQLDLSGFYRGYGVFADNDETTTAGAGDELREFDFRHDAEIHFTGETTVDNGLTIGVHAEVELAGDATEDDLDEVYSYFSSNWGRVNFGKEDGAGYLLQVAAPSADSNVDGLRTYVQALDTTTGGNGFALVTANGGFGQSTTLDYAMDAFEGSHKITYLTPKFSGFQAGVSWAPEVSDSDTSINNALGAPATLDDAGEFDNALEIAARWDGDFEGVAVSAGAGYQTASEEDNAAVGGDDYEAYNLGLNLAFTSFELGASWGENNNAEDSDGDVETLVIGAGWNNGPYTLGASYFDRTYETAAAAETDVERWTAGGTYTFADGMSFRGSVSFGELDSAGTANDRDFTQVTVGTDISF